MAVLHPRFNDDERRRLASVHGLTGPQLMWLERDLGGILDELGPHVRMEEVRAELRELSDEIAKASKRLQRWARATKPSPGREALGHLSIAGKSLERSARPSGGTCPEPIVASDLIQLIAVIAKKAADAAPSTRRPPHPASPRAIAKIIERLHRPTDEASRKSAAALVPRRAEHSKKSGPSFRGVADIVFAAAYRALNSHQGNPTGHVPNAATSIRAYLEKLPLAKRQPRGRPSKRSAPIE